MPKTPREVDKILEAKYKVACDRDLLQNLLWYLRGVIASLEKSYKQKPCKHSKERIRHYRFIAGSIIQSIEAANTLLKPASSFKTSCIFTFFEIRIQTIRQVSDIFAHKFIQIHSKCAEMVQNVTSLKHLIYA